MDRDSTHECAAADRGLVCLVVWPGFGLLYSDVIKLCRIKYFPAVLALDEFDIVLAGDDFDDGMFAL